MILVLIALLPGIIIGLITYFVDKKEREPLLQLLKAILFGIISVLLTLIISNVLKIGNVDIDDSLIRVFFASFIEIALIEEFCKWICGRIVLHKNKDFNYMFDGIVYYIFVALGFATIENIIYITNTSITVGLLRAITTVPAHAFFAAAMGYYYALSKREKFKGNMFEYKKNMVLSLIVPVLLHGFYDFLIFSGIRYLFYLYIVFLVSLYIFSIDNIKRMERIDHLLNSKNIHCRNCGKEKDVCECDK